MSVTTWQRPTIATVPPGPSGNFLLGNLTEFRRDRHRYLRDLQQEYGDIVRFRLGREPFYLIAHPDDILHVLGCNNRNYHKSKPYQVLSHTVGKQSIILTEDQEWQCQRHTLNPHFKRATLNRFADMIVDTTTTMLDQWELVGKQQGELDIVDEMLALTMRIICKALFSIEIDAEIERVRRAFATILTIGTPWLESPLAPFFGVLKWVPTRNHRDFRGALHTLDTLVYRMIEERRNGSDQGDLLSALIFAQQEPGDEQGPAMSDQALRDQIMTLFIGGHDTSASVLSWLFYLLSSHPTVTEQLSAEVDATLADRQPTTADLDAMPYCHQVIKETMRLYPPAPLVGRQALAEDTLGGFAIPAGSNIFISQYVTHRHPAFWHKPDDFDPDRFTTQQAKDRSPFAYFPFGGGARFCLGDKFATLVLRLVVPMVMQRVQLQCIPGHIVKPAALLTLRPEPGMPMTVRPVTERRSQ